MGRAGRPSAPETARRSHRARRAALLLAALLLPPPQALALGSRKAAPLPWTVRMVVHWGAVKNRDAYREGFARQLMERLIEQRCFRDVVDKGEAELLLDVQLNEFITEQEYATVPALVPGQGEEHRMIAARASVNLDYWLSPDGRMELEIVTGHVFREITRENLGSADPTEARALKELLKDATGWVARDLCGQREKLAKRIDRALAEPRPAPASPPSPQAGVPVP